MGVDRNAGLDDDLWSDDVRAEPEHDAVADLRAGPAVGIDLLVRRQRAERLGIRAQRLEEALVQAAHALVELEDAGSVTPAVETPARAGVVEGPAVAAACAIAASTSFSVMKPRFSIEPRSMPWRSASSTALFVALRSAAFASTSGFGSRRASAASTSSATSATSAIVFPSSTSSPSSKSWTSVPLPGASISTVAFVVSTTQTGWPCST